MAYLDSSKFVKIDIKPTWWIIFVKASTTSSISQDFSKFRLRRKLLSILKVAILVLRSMTLYLTERLWTAVLKLIINGKWLELSPQLPQIRNKLVRIPEYTTKSNKSGILLRSEGKYVGLLMDKTEKFFLWIDL